VSDVGFITILITAIGLSADCFAVALSISISQRRLTFPQFIRFPVAFGLFQVAMLVIGWLVGRKVVEYIAAYDHWLAFALLAIIGGRMIWQSFREKEEERTGRDLQRWFTLLALGVATSIDSLAVGLSYAFLRVNIVLAADAWGFKVKVVPGYRGAAGQFKAVEGGEVDITCNSEIPTLPRLKAKTVIPIAYVTLERQKLLPDIPAISETPPTNKAAFERFKKVIWVYRHERALAMPPGVPADRIKFVTAAFKKTLLDKTLLKEGAKNGIKFIYTDQKAYRREHDKLFGGMSAKDKEHVKALLR